jgi:hypothetical protein
MSLSTGLFAAVVSGKRGSEKTSRTVVLVPVVGRRNTPETVGNDGYVYFTLVGRTAVPTVSGVFRLPTTGTNTTVREVFSEPLLPLTTVANSPVLNDIASDDDWVYVTTESEVRAIAKRGTQTGVSRVLVANQPRPRGIAVDATHVYWSTLGAGTTVTAGNVRRIAKPPAPAP